MNQLDIKLIILQNSMQNLTNLVFFLDIAAKLEVYLA